MFRFLAVAFSITVFMPAASASNPEEEAQKSAEQWLAFVDAGDAAGSWSTASDTFRKTVGEEQWEQSLNAIRKTLGDIVSRKLKIARYTRSLADAPKGQYVVLEFKTSFANNIMLSRR